jgi:rubrerythrin
MPDTLFHNIYLCSECGTTWTDEWKYQCNDRCPNCNVEIEPFDSIEIELPTAP